MNVSGQNGEGLTAEIAEQALALRFADLPQDVISLAKQCALDWFAVALAGANEPLVQKLAEEAVEQGAHPQATAIGLRHKASMAQAALINGAASHALDYDDVNLAILGHPTVAVLPGLLALAEHRCATGEQFITAFIAGYETACRIGKALSPGHFNLGFHATATVGGFGAAVACAHLLGLNTQQTRYAIGIASTQAAGLKSMFGSMCKPLHAGNAALNGLQAATRAARGFDSNENALECAQGFAATHGPQFLPDAARAAPPQGFYIRENLFKYHAACYLTHSVIECAHRLRNGHHLIPDQIASAMVTVDEICDKACNIQEPRTGLEAKFSLRATTAFSLTGLDTASFETFSDANANDSALNLLRDKVSVAFVAGGREALGRLDITLKNGTRLSTTHDSGIPDSDVNAQGARIDAKAQSLLTPVIGANRAAAIAGMTARLETHASLTPLGEHLSVRH